MRILVTGNVNVDILMGRLDDWPERGTETILPEYELRLGGPLGNMLLALSALGSDAAFHTNVGDDVLGRQLGRQLAEHGCRAEVSSAPTSVTVGLVHGDGQRTFLTSPGHLDTFSLDATFAAVEAAMPGDLLFVCGYFLLPEMQRRSRELLALARQRGLVTALDTGWPPDGWSDSVRAEVRGLLEHCTWFLPNEVELRETVGAAADADTAELLTALDADRDGTTVVKLGPEGAAWLEGGRLRRVSAPRVTVADSIGAGDSFNAGFVAALQRGCDTQRAITLATEVACSAITSSPRRYPRWEELALPAD